LRILPSSCGDVLVDDDRIFQPCLSEEVIYPVKSIFLKGNELKWLKSLLTASELHGFSPDSGKAEQQRVRLCSLHIGIDKVGSFNAAAICGTMMVPFVAMRQLCSVKI